MELMAAIQGLKKINGGSVIPAKAGIQGLNAQINLYTDSSYVINGITKWVKGWKKNGWQTKTKQSVLNRDLWEELDGLNSKLPVKWNYVGGHVGILGNERCDHIATAFADGMKIKLYEGTLAGYDLPDILNISLDEALQTKKSSDSAHSRAKAYSYVSMVQGVIETHHTWAECEKRVKGVAGAKFRKAESADDEAKIMAEFEAI
jgi:ribonuclease HI